MADIFKKILIIGAQGQVGSSLSALIPADRRVSLTRQELDLSQSSEIQPVLSRIAPDCVINASAYTQVDLAEKEAALAHAINAEAPAQMAQWCKEHQVPFVHYSTDYVFDGSGLQARGEADPVSPLNTYGKTKAEGEKRIAAIGGDHLILRTSWVYHDRGRNFLRTMIRLFQEKETLRIVADQVGAPTYAFHLAQATLQALTEAASQQVFPSGVYHLAHQGETSWYGFTCKIADEMRSRAMNVVTTDIIPITSQEYPTPARRPLNSRLALGKIRETLGIELPHWEIGLSECMEKLSRENH